jgi:hypothetical protein
MKKIVFLSQMGFVGQIPRTHPNMRVEFAQMCALQADHYPLLSVNQIQTKYDVAVLLIPKTPTDRDALYNIDIVSEARKIADKVVFMQEGPSWIYQDLPVHQQIWHYNLLTSVDGILSENETDIPYFKGINPKVPIQDIPSLMIEDSVLNARLIEKQDKVMIGGNFTRWYGGFDSYVIATEFDLPIYCPSMGRKQPNEEQLVTHLPYLQWNEWISALAEFKYAIHLMPTIAAGTFAMNCGFLGVPCIGYNEADTQRKIHPKLSVDLGDLESARKLAIELKNNKSFYKECSIDARGNYRNLISEAQFLSKMENYFNQLCKN